MSTLGLILISVVVVSLISLVGVVFLALKKELLNKILLILIAFSSGALLGAAFLDLIPEGLKERGEGIFLLVLLGILLFFIVEKFLHWQHCHEGECNVHTFAYLNLFGDGIHNFIDGMAIAGAYLVSIPLGVSVTLAVILHEIPQEIGDFGILVYGGFSRKKALLFNLLSALTAVVGGVLAFYLAKIVSGLESFLIPLAAGGFIYIATVDLLPELKNKGDGKNSALQLLFILLGLGLIWWLKQVF